MTFRTTALLLLVISIFHECKSQQQQLDSVNGTMNSEKPVVFITVSSLASYPDTPDRLLELNWYNIDHDENSAVRLFSNNPHTSNLSDYLTSVNTNEHGEYGYYKTDVQLPRYNFNAENLTDECLPYWIAYIRNDQVISTSCFRTFPNWMHNMKNVIENASLMELVIPGTHNAGSYAQFDPTDDTILRKYLVNQEESVFNQLVYGIRYLDLRVSYERVDDSSEKFWITHGIFRTEIPLSRVVEEVKMFLNSTKEVVIMDFHRFVNGFVNKRAASRHRLLISYLESELSDFMIPASFSSWVTLGELWQIDRRLYVGYASNSDRTSSPYLLPAVRHLWGDKDKVQELFDYLNSTVCTRRQKLTSAMAQLTPTTSGAIFDVYGGLRKMADDINRLLTRWFRNLWAPCSNIVSTDFFLGNNIIRTSIELNKRRFCPMVNSDLCTDA